jgi:hypothetical protein
MEAIFSTLLGMEVFILLFLSVQSIDIYMLFQQKILVEIPSRHSLSKQKGLLS